MKMWHDYQNLKRANDYKNNTIVHSRMDRAHNVKQRFMEFTVLSTVQQFH